MRRAGLLAALVLSACASPQQSARDRLGDAGLAVVDTFTCDEVDELNSVYFESGTAQMVQYGPVEPLRRLDQNLSVLERCPEITTQILGWTGSEYEQVDSTGRLNHTALSQQRAEVVQGYYLSQGLSPTRIEKVWGLGQHPTNGVHYPEEDFDEEAYRRLMARSRRVDSIPSRLQPSGQ